MITTPTVFVLGAGASADFSFPVGKELLEIVVSFRGGNGGRNNLVELGCLNRDIDTFCSALNYSADASIDAFLEKRPEFMEIGKIAMATHLIGCEQLANLFGERNGFNWLKYLFRKMQGGSFEAFGENEVSFVTFNYDRVVEQFLSTALQNAWGKSERDAGALIAKIPIIHLHGQLGLLPWQSPTNARAFDGIVSTQNIRIAANGIKVVHEGVEDRRKQFDDAKELIRLAKRVYFLGVGTSNVNLERIGVMDFEDGKAAATEVGLTQTEFNEVHARYGNKLSFLQGRGCREMISNYVEWT
jgi:hypothetical protein